MSDLRGLLGAGEPSPQRWDALILRLEQCGDMDLLTQVALPYCEDHLTRWPDRLRRWPGWWSDMGASLAETPPSPLIALIRRAEDEAPSAQAVELLGTTPLLDRITQWITGPYPYSHNLTLSLARNTRLSNLRRIELRGVQTMDEGAIALAAASHLSSVRVLRLDEASIGIKGARALAQSPHLKGLTTLSLRNVLGNTLTDQLLTSAQAQHFITALPNLTALDLSGHNLGKGLEPSEEAKHNGAQLKALSMAWASLQPQAGQALASSPALGDIQTLDLSSNALKDEGIEGLAVRRWDQLSTLNLTQNQLTDAAAPSLARLLHNGRISHLSLAENRALGAGITQMLRDAPPGPLHTLELNDTGCSDDALYVLSQRRTSRSLRVLDLSGTPITDAGVHILAQSPHLDSLASLRLLDCAGVTQKALDALCDALPNCIIWSAQGHINRLPWEQNRS